MAGIARYSDHEWFGNMPNNQGGTAEMPFVPDKVKGFALKELMLQGDYFSDGVGRTNVGRSSRYTS